MVTNLGRRAWCCWWPRPAPTLRGTCTRLCPGAPPQWWAACSCPPRSGSRSEGTAWSPCRSRTTSPMGEAVTESDTPVCKDDSNMVRGRWLPFMLHKYVCRYVAGWVGWGRGRQRKDSTHYRESIHGRGIIQGIYTWIMNQYCRGSFCNKFLSFFFF